MLNYITYLPDLTMVKPAMDLAIKYSLDPNRTMADTINEIFDAMLMAMTDMSRHVASETMGIDLGENDDFPLLTYPELENAMGSDEVGEILFSEYVDYAHLINTLTTLNYSIFSDDHEDEALAAEYAVMDLTTLFVPVYDLITRDLGYVDSRTSLTHVYFNCRYEYDIYAFNISVDRAA